MKPATSEADTPEQTRLRELRAWHWREAMRHRKVAKDTTSKASERHFNKMADTHIKFVQTLNDFFPVGDNAEQDVTDPTGYY